MDNHIQKLWLMPPIYQRVLDYLRESIKNEKGDYQLTLIARYVGWYSADSWEQPSPTAIKDILYWLDKNNFISLQKIESSSATILITNKQKPIRSQSTLEYQQFYTDRLEIEYRIRSGKPAISDEDYSAMLELAVNDIPLEDAVLFMNACFEVGKNAPDFSYVKDYIFARFCLNLVMSR